MESIKILITGISGFIGSNLARHFLNSNYEIYGLTRNQKANWRLESIKDQLNLERGDITIYDKLYDHIKAIRPDGIFHCSQYGAYPTELDLNNIYRVNLTGAFNLINAASQLGISWLINAGSSFEYGNSSEKLSETDSCKPASNYGVFKCLSSDLVSLFSNVSKTKTVTLRIFQAYGPYESTGRLASYVLYNLLKNNPITLKSPNLKRDFVFIEDISTAFEKSIDIFDSIDRNEIINIGTGKSIRVIDFVKIGKSVTESKSRVDYGDYSEKPEDTINKLEANISKARKLLDWNPKYGLREGLKVYSRWMESQLEFYTT